MTLFSWTYMIAVWAGITALNGYCFYKVLRKPTINRFDDSQNGNWIPPDGARTPSAERSERSLPPCNPGLIDTRPRASSDL